MIGDDLERKPEELVLPLEKRFEYHKCLSFECMVVMLSISQLF